MYSTSKKIMHGGYIEAVVIYAVYKVSHKINGAVHHWANHSTTFFVVGKFVAERNVLLLFSVDEDYEFFWQYFNRICAGGYKTVNTCVIS